MSSFYFNNKSVKEVPCQMILDTKLNFQEDLKNILNKVNKTVGLLQKLQNILQRRPLLTIYKSFIRPHLDYGDIIYDQHYNNSFHQKLESIQYNAALQSFSKYLRLTLVFMSNSSLRKKFNFCFSKVFCKY